MNSVYGLMAQFSWRASGVDAPGYDSDFDYHSVIVLFSVAAIVAAWNVQRKVRTRLQAYLFVVLLVCLFVVSESYFIYALKVAMQLVGAMWIFVCSDRQKYE